MNYRQLGKKLEPPGPIRTWNKACAVSSRWVRVRINDPMKQRVLVVDDNQDFCELVKCTLETADLEVTVAQSGSEALECSRMIPPDLILLDVVMPEVDGLSVCEALRADITTQDVPIIIITGLRSDMTRCASYEAGADDYLVKPFSCEQLLHRVSHFVEVSKKAET
jgi:DNA-binding response OmpR family regulator